MYHCAICDAQCGSNLAVMTHLADQSSSPGPIPRWAPDPLAPLQIADASMPDSLQHLVPRCKTR